MQSSSTFKALASVVVADEADLEVVEDAAVMVSVALIFFYMLCCCDDVKMTSLTAHHDRALPVLGCRDIT